MGFWGAVALAEPYANNPHLAANTITTSARHHSIFYRPPDTLPDTNGTVSKHWRPITGIVGMVSEQSGTDILVECIYAGDTHVVYC